MLKIEGDYLALNIPAMNPIIRDITSSKILKPRFTTDIKVLDKVFDKSSIHTHPFKKLMQGSAFKNHLIFNQVSDGYELFALVFCKAKLSIAGKMIRG